MEEGGNCDVRHERESEVAERQEDPTAPHLSTGMEKNRKRIPLS